MLKNNLVQTVITSNSSFCQFSVNTFYYFKRANNYVYNLKKFCIVCTENPHYYSTWVYGMYCKPSCGPKRVPYM